eukprot:5932148-Pyramimonas_sp.AAC.1
MFFPLEGLMGAPGSLLGRAPFSAILWPSCVVPRFSWAVARPFWGLSGPSWGELSYARAARASFGAD